MPPGPANQTRSHAKSRQCWEEPCLPPPLGSSAASGTTWIMYGLVRPSPDIGAAGGRGNRQLHPGGACRVHRLRRVLPPPLRSGACQPAQAKEQGACQAVHKEAPVGQGHDMQVIGRQAHSPEQAAGGTKVAQKHAAPLQAPEQAKARGARQTTRRMCLQQAGSHCATQQAQRPGATQADGKLRRRTPAKKIARHGQGSC